MSIASNALLLVVSAVIMNDDDCVGEVSPELAITGGLGCATDVELKWISETRELV